MRGYHIHMITIQRTSHLQIHDIFWPLCRVSLELFDLLALIAQKSQSFEVVHTYNGRFYLPWNFHCLLMFCSIIAWDFIIHCCDKIRNWVGTNLKFQNIGEAIKRGTLHLLSIGSTCRFHHRNLVTLLSNGNCYHRCIWRCDISVGIVSGMVISL